MIINFLFGIQAVQPVHTFTEHLAAVKAIAWSPHHPGLLASGGGTADRCIRFWNKLTGHHYRVLSLAMSPDGESIVTGAGDETLRFWNVFSKARSQKESRSALNLFTSIR